MRLLTTQHKNIDYEFRLLEVTDVIQISKDNVFTYEIRIIGRRYVCNCPGARYHGYCWHWDMITDVYNSPRINEPWAVWAEEAELCKLTLRKKNI